MQVNVKVPKKHTLGDQFRQEARDAEQRRADHVQDTKNRELAKLSAWLSKHAEKLTSDLEREIERMKVRNIWHDVDVKPMAYEYDESFNPPAHEVTQLEGYKLFAQKCRALDIHCELGTYVKYWPNGGKSDARFKISANPGQPYVEPDDSMPPNPHTGPSI